MVDIKYIHNKLSDDLKSLSLGFVEGNTTIQAHHENIGKRDALMYVKNITDDALKINEQIMPILDDKINILKGLRKPITLILISDVDFLKLIEEMGSDGDNLRKSGNYDKNDKKIYYNYRGYKMLINCGDILPSQIIII